MYSNYHGLILAHSYTEPYRRPIGGFYHTERDIPNYRRSIVGMSLTEHVMTR